MSAELNLQQYNSIARQTLVPFDESEISQRKQNPNDPNSQTFSYVPPERYRYRALRVFTNGYQFGTVPNSVEIGKTGVKAEFRFRGTVEDAETMTSVEYDVTVPVFETWTLKRETQDILNPDQTMSKLASAGFKGCMREIGMGLHLYDKPARTVSGGSAAPRSNSGGSAAPAAAPAASGDQFDASWDGSAGLPINVKGQKGVPYRDLDDGLITWLCTKENPDKGALKERARRQKNAVNDVQTPDDDDDIPF